MSLRQYDYLEVLDLICLAFFDTEFGRRQGVKLAEIKRLTLRVFSMIGQQSDSLNTSEPPPQRAIRKYGRTLIAKQLTSFLKGSIGDAYTEGGRCWISETMPLLLFFQMPHCGMGGALYECGTYATLIRRIWAVLGSGADDADCEVTGALHYGLTVFIS